MPDLSLARRDPFAGLLPRSASTGVATPVAISPRPDVRLATVIARTGERAELVRRLDAACPGLSLPEGLLRTTAGGLSALGIGPRAWLVVAENGSPGFAQRLADGLGAAAAVSDQSDGYAVLRVAGPAARAVLAKGLPVDLHARAFGPADVAVTMCGGIGVTLWQADEAPSFDLALFRSYAGSFAHWLRESAAEFGPAIGG